MSKIVTRRSLEQITINEPCHVAWDAMGVAGAGTRHCEHCAKPVHDLSAMSREDAERLIEPGAAPACVRFARDAAGRVLTREDFNHQPPRTSRRSWMRRAAAMAAALGIGSLFNLGCDRPAPAALQGSPAVSEAQQMKVGEIDMGDVAPATQPTTVPTTAPAEPEMLMGIIAPVPPPPVMGRVRANPPTRSQPLHGKASG